VEGDIGGLGALAVCVPVLMGIMQLIRKTPVMERCKDYFSWIAVMLGLVASFLWLDPATPVRERIIMGVMAGLAVSGLYDSTKVMPGINSIVKAAGPAAVILICCLLIVGGCGGVNLSPQYANLVAQNAAWSADAAQRASETPPEEGCYVGRWTCEQAAEVIQLNADYWRLFDEASRGVNGQK